MKCIKDMSEQDFSNAIEKIYPGVLTINEKGLIYEYFRDYEKSANDALEFSLVVRGGCDALYTFLDYARSYYIGKAAAHDRFQQALGISKWRKCS